MAPPWPPTVAPPRFIQLAAARRTRHQRRLSRRRVRHKTGKKPRNHHAARQRARHNRYPPAQPLAEAHLAPAAPSATSSGAPRQSANWGKAKQRVGRAYRHLQRQREDFARKQASVLSSSHDLLALEDLPVRNLVRNRRLATAVSDVSWSRLRRWLPGVPIKLMGDIAYSILQLGLHCTRQQITLIAPLRLDSVPHQPPPVRDPHTIGRPRVMGPRLPALEHVLTDPATVWQRLTLDWYGEGQGTVEVWSGTACW
jgi:hypothetical protein